MAKRTRKMGRGKDMSSDDMTSEDEEDDSDESEKSPKRRVKKVMVEETFAKGGAVRSKNSSLQQVSGFKFSGTY